ncbi:hypothetical protein ACRRTK_012546 [Alexandromys fortis]
MQVRLACCREFEAGKSYIRPQEGQDWLGEADKGRGEEQWKDAGPGSSMPNVESPREGRPVTHCSRFYPQP